MPHSRTKPRSNVGDLVALIRDRSDALPTAQRQVAHLLVADPEFALRANVADLAMRAKVSPPTIIRFCRALGFAGLREFKLKLARSLANGTPYLHRAVRQDDAMDVVVHKVLYGAASALTNLEWHIAPAVLDQAVARLAKAKRVDCYGVGSTSSFIAADAQARFFRLGLASNAYFDAHFQLISAASLKRGDVVLAISYVGRMPSLMEAVEVAREQGAIAIAITQPGSLLAKRADYVLPVVVPADASMRVGTEAYLVQMAYLEILMIGVALRRGAPALARLKRVREVLQERGVDSEAHPALQWAWSKAELNPS
jgi:RpiR family carbohydrate utilization transcriptional regulator